jgi:hypothetical protein
LRDAAEGVVGEICGVAICVGDAQQIIFRVVAVGGDVAGGVGDGGQAVGGVIRVAGGFAVLVGGRGAPAARIVGEG